MDYVVVKVPRWDLQKFRNVGARLGTGMKSVGEVMAIGRSFEEALQKSPAHAGYWCQRSGGKSDRDSSGPGRRAAPSTDKRIFAIAAALEAGYTLEHIHELTHIDPWFLAKLDNILNIAGPTEKLCRASLSQRRLQEAKRRGFLRSANCGLSRER